MVDSQTWGYRWRSSQAFVIFTVSLGLFSDTFLYGFIVPILSYMVEVRLSLPPSQTQKLATALLTTHGVVSVASAPIIAHFADKTSNRQTPLLLALGGCLAGTLLLAFSRSVWMLFLSRILQAASGSAGWIVCFATLTDHVPPEHTGKVIGTAMSFVTGGIVAGPVVSGALLQLLGYWSAWSAPLILLALDAVARLVMIEKRDEKTASSHDEREGLLASQKPLPTEPDPEQNLPPSPRGFYQIVLSNIGVLAGLLNSLLFSIILSAFDTTLPLYLEKELHWDTLSVGVIFLGLQAPGMILGPVAGWIRDRTGVRSQTTIGWVLIAVLLCLLGMPGTGVEWASSIASSKLITVAAILGIGCFFPLVRGSGTFQLIAVTNDLQSKDPTIFGPHGGTSRVFSLLEIAFSTGAILGPLLSGTLSGVFGFPIMVFTLAIICLLVAVLSFFLLTNECAKSS